MGVSTLFVVLYVPSSVFFTVFVSLLAGTLVVDLPAEVAEAPLLASEGGGGRPDGLLLEGLVHAPVPTIVLGMGG